MPIDATMVEEAVTAVLREMNLFSPAEKTQEKEPSLQAVIPQITPAVPVVVPIAQLPAAEPVKQEENTAHKDFSDPQALERMLQKTSARIGVGKTGARLRTDTLLHLRADHAAARDAVILDVDASLLDALGLFAVQTKCTNRNEHLTRPDLGKIFEQETLNELLQKCKTGADVQIFASDGLSSRAIEANLANILPVLNDALAIHGLSAGTPFFVKYGRVAAQDTLAEALGCKVICTLIGERPGLGSAESMSAYIAYKPTVGMPEANRTVVSNIYSGGTPAAEAGAYIADLVVKMIEQQASGVNLK
ncbi:MAG: ethanolamine ammonia-lyase subunit EutC [Oscillospiraceae bacterium]|jgi:ethanolamine ammonia-lyase small subunit|nr:ethanolamine ammonia-lyase subunit EutC [Oscillospiraceae bacterium]